MLAESQDIPDEKALTAAAYFHCRLEIIHPFADGSGRVGRLVMNYFLLLHSHPPIIIHEEGRRAYFEALEAWETVQDPAPMIDFLKEQTEKHGGSKQTESSKSNL